MKELIYVVSGISFPLLPSDFILESFLSFISLPGLPTSSSALLVAEVGCTGNISSNLRTSFSY